jgi:hypothetical protein
MGIYAPNETIGGERGAQFDVAQICLNGHVANEHFRTRPELNQDFCVKCGEKTITTCPKCGVEIRGGRIGTLGFYNAPPCCIKCGAQFPWTERKTQAAIELFIEESGFTGEDAKQFEEAVHDAVNDGPRTQVAGTRIGKALIKAGGQAGKLFYDVIKDLLSEIAKKAIWPNQPPHSP